MIRILDGHKVNPANDRLEVRSMDEPGAGGAHHIYEIAVPADGKHLRPYHHVVGLHFQNGPIADVGVNGITHEALIAILIDRLECFQAGPYANDFNYQALKHLQEAQKALLERTRARMARGVEGTHTI